MLNCVVHVAGILSAAGTKGGGFSFMVPGPSRIVDWNDSNMGGSDYKSLSGEKDLVKSNVMLST